MLEVSKTETFICLIRHVEFSIPTMVGSFLPTAVLGLNTERYKQSSCPSKLLVFPFICGQRTGVELEFRVPVQGAAGFGGLKWRLPMGGSAKGIPQNVSTCLFVRFFVTPREEVQLINRRKVSLEKPPFPVQMSLTVP